MKLLILGIGTIAALSVIALALSSRKGESLPGSHVCILRAGESCRVFTDQIELQFVVGARVPDSAPLGLFQIRVRADLPGGLSDLVYLDEDAAWQFAVSPRYRITLLAHGLEWSRSAAGGDAEHCDRVRLEYVVTLSPHAVR